MHVVVVAITLLVFPESENDWTKFIVASESRFATYRINEQIWDRTRPDLLSKYEVIEVDWDRKWKEGVGQACFYAAATDKRGALLLLLPNGINSEKARTYAYRAKISCTEAGLKLYLYDCQKRKLVLQ